MLAAPLEDTQHTWSGCPFSIREKEAEFHHPREESQIFLPGKLKRVDSSAPDLEPFAAARDDFSLIFSQIPLQSCCKYEVILLVTAARFLCFITYLCIISSSRYLCSSLCLHDLAQLDNERSGM